MGKGPVSVHQGDSELVAIETRARKGAPPRPPLSAGSARNRRRSHQPAGGRSRTYSGPAQCKIETLFVRRGARPREGRAAGAALPPLSFSRCGSCPPLAPEDLGTRGSALVAIETRTKKGAAPESRPSQMRGCSNRQDPLLPGPLPAPMSVPPQCRLTPGSVSDSAIPGPCGFPFSRWCLSPLTPKFAGGTLAAPRACGFEGKLAWVSLHGAAVDYPLTAALSMGKVECPTQSADNLDN
jgi:hypothetical protein